MHKFTEKFFFNSIHIVKLHRINLHIFMSEFTYSVLLKNILL